MQEVEFRLTGDRLTHNGATRHLSAPDWDRFAAWTRTYHDLCWHPGNDDRLLALGRQIHDWLNGDERWLAALRDQQDTPVIADFAVAGSATEHDRAFLEVPWELAAIGDTWLAADPEMMWAPLRRIGAAATPPAANATHRLGVMFMAAAPRGQSPLDIEAEEAAILRATANIGMDLIVEDTGELAELTTAWGDVPALDVLHLSCHGSGGDTPVLALEDEDGERAKVTLDDLAGAFVEAKPRLLFLSACHTGEGNATVDSLARGLIRVGFPAVLGWADAVFDRDASAFAASFYRRAAQRGSSIQAAWASARYDLLRQPRPPTHWHLARLFLGRTGGGALNTGSAVRLRDDPNAGQKGVLNAPGRQIEVASRLEFVGRRPQVKAIQREFRRNAHAGVAILGLGRQGKSSLAAHIIDRHPALKPVVLFQACDGPTVLAEISRHVDGAAELCARYRDKVDPHRPDQYEPNALFHALRALLQGPCKQSGADHGAILLLLDDFEALLDPPPSDTEIHSVKPDAAAPLAAIIRAFADSTTDSRLLITCRFRFRLPDRGQDLAARLLDVPLPTMSPADSLKQARHKLAVAGGTADADRTWFTADFQPRAIEAAHGNAGLQDLLFQVALADRAAGEAAVAALLPYLAGQGALPEQQQLRDTLEKLAIDQLRAWLTEGERHLLEASTVVRLPVPLPVWQSYASRTGSGGITRLLAFGLWERVPDLVVPRADAVLPNAIGAAHIDVDNIANTKQIAAKVLADLFAAWGGTDRSRTPYATDIELTRLAVLCGDCDVLVSTAEHAIRGQESAFEYRAAAATAADVLDTLHTGGRALSADLLRAAAELFDRVGDADRLRLAYAQAATLMRDAPSLSRDERTARAGLRLRYGAYQLRQGDPDAALQELEAAQAVFEALSDRRSRAVTLGDIARILRGKGEVDQALELHKQRLQTYEALGDRRSRAVTLGDIARILTDKGEVDQALELHNEQVHIFEALGDRRSRAVTLGDIARILTDKGEVDQALELHNEQVHIFEALGDRRERAVTLGDIARILTDKGEVDQALELHKEEMQTYEALGDRRSRAVTLGDVARILTNKGEVDQALASQRERLHIMEGLGDQGEVAAASFDIGQTRLRQAMQGNDAAAFQEAFALLDRSYRILLAIGRLDGICMVGATLGQVLAMGGQTEEARTVLTRSRDGFRKLGQAQFVAQMEEMLRQIR